MSSAPFVYPYAGVRRRLADDALAVQGLLHAGLAGYFADAPTDREAVAIATLALINHTLTRTGY
jgi:hypothetical protein